MLNEISGFDTPTNKAGVVYKNLLRQFLTTYRKNRLDELRKNHDCLESHIELFVADCIRLDQPAFYRAKKGNVFVPTPLGKFYFYSISGYLKACCLVHSGSPAIELFVAACNEVGVTNCQFSDPAAMTVYGCTEAELLNQLVEKISTKGRAAEYRKMSAQYIEKDFRRFRGLVEYVDSLFDNVRSRLMVIRIDLKYRTDSIDKMKVGQAQADLRHLFNNMRSKPGLFDDLVGCIWKLESSSHEREHFHVVLFFTNDQLDNDSWRGELIGEYWSSVITQGRGTFFNCNRSAEKAKQRRLCLGRIEYFDNRMRGNLLYLLAYLCKNEQQSSSKPKELSRVYGRRKMPEVFEKTVGRKRSIKPLPNAHIRSALKVIGCEFDVLGHPKKNQRSTEKLNKCQ